MHTHTHMHTRTAETHDKVRMPELEQGGEDGVRDFEGALHCICGLDHLLVPGHRGAHGLGHKRPWHAADAKPLALARILRGQRVQRWRRW
ncbi:MAG: hypothetical protein CME96_08595 [Hyphomonas sp.]|nr:hypothetical protein [Hyphomonas sp.]